MDFEINTKRKHLFLGLAFLSLVILMLITWLLWWFVAPRFDDINTWLRPLSLTLLRIFFVVLILGTAIVYMTSLFEKNFLFAKFPIRIFNRIMFPITVLLGQTIGIAKEKTRESYVFVNNSFIKALKNKSFHPNNVLILLPHCLQYAECTFRINVNINNCKECGRCTIGPLVKLAREYSVPIAIATGGTLARRIVKKYRPKFVIAVACERDLVSGIQDIFPIPVYGVLNERPEGPCYNTRVDISKIRDALEKVVISEDKYTD